MKTLIILAIAILGCVNAMGQQTVDLDKASQRLKKSDLPFKSCKVMAYTNQGVEYRGKACATYRDLSRKKRGKCTYPSGSRSETDASFFLRC